MVEEQMVAEAVLIGVIAVCVGVLLLWALGGKK